MAILRESITTDATQVAMVIRQSVTQLCFADHHGQQDVLDAWLENKNPESLSDWILADDAYCVTATDTSGLVIGFGMLARTGEVKLLYVGPSQKGAGVGQALLQNMEAKAAGWHLTQMCLDSTKAAQSFYEHQGYEYRGACGARSDGLSCLAMLKRIAA
jgi:GNAT superfamily N-acetyltransferase